MVAVKHQIPAHEASRSVWWPISKGARVVGVELRLAIATEGGEGGEGSQKAKGMEM